MKNLILIFTLFFFNQVSNAQIGLLDSTFLAKLPNTSTGLFHTQDGELEIQKDGFAAIELRPNGAVRVNEGYVWTQSNAANFLGIANLGSLGVTNGSDWNLAIAGFAAVDTIGSASGYFGGDVEIYGSLYFPSDKNLKKDLKAIEGVLPKIMELNPTEYEYLKKYNWAKGKQTGFIAQELKETFPHLVDARNMMLVDENGTPNGQIQKINSINYIGLVSILTKGIQEQQALLEDQEARLILLEKRMEELMESSFNESEKPTLNNNISKDFLLEQNIPNPFQNTTLIKYHISPSAKNAHLVIRSIDGKVLKNIAIPSSREGQIEVNLSGLPNGIYLYSLQANNQILVTKKMKIEN